ncbi:hypothetical protein PASE110613_09120 [Paenibacillus sediminis]|uniref:Uncharacterized protein n=1 Tax=Paenibacillus sediminis TaxID=664909 RepID=A0ABS4H6M1_9BACL|nr:hypothetical protein [Paenibacillus sediminis]MBP1938193.1 hypothetical protein [Paenibacillus sediminis]
MAIIPLKQTVTVTKAGADSGWGHTDSGAVVMYKARVTEQTSVVINQFGAEAVSSMTIIFDKLPDVSYDDVITYTNELGVTIARKPLAIEPRRMLNGKPILTEVYV